MLFPTPLDRFDILILIIIAVIISFIIIFSDHFDNHRPGGCGP